LIVALDNTFLSLVLKPDSRPRSDPSTGVPVDFCRERIEAMIDRHSSNGDTVLIPTPCLAELLTAVPDISRVIGAIQASAAFEIASFDARCAIELGIVTQEAIRSGDKKGGVSAGWQEVKFDRQIVVIAKVNGAEIIYTDDGNQTIIAEQLGLRVKHSWQLELPLNYRQGKFNLDTDTR
jgi:hypothetical protein